MTLMDLFRLIRKYWIIVVATTLVCGAAAGAYLMMSKGGSGHSATAAIVGNSQATGVMSFAKAEGEALVGADSDYKVEAKTETGTTTVSVTVTGPKEDECIKLANEIAVNTYDRAVEAYENFENPFSGNVKKADKSEQVTSGGGKKYLAVGLLGGLFLGVCIVVVIDLIRRPVKSIEGMQDLVELPVLEKLPAESGERLLANIRFASKKENLERVCVVPLGMHELAQEVCNLIDVAMRAEGANSSRDIFQVVACDSLAQSMNGAYDAQKADAVIVVARQWTDSLATLESTVAELKLAKADIVGLVFAK